jgi:hypothetical protein
MQAKQVELTFQKLPEHVRKFQPNQFTIKIDKSATLHSLWENIKKSYSELSRKEYNISFGKKIFSEDTTVDKIVEKFPDIIDKPVTFSLTVLGRAKKELHGQTAKNKYPYK